MANDLTGNPLILDTAAAAPIRLYSNEARMKIREVIWRNPATAGDDLVLTINGVAVARKSTTSGNADYAVFEQPLGWVDTFALTTRDSGTVEVWLD